MHTHALSRITQMQDECLGETPRVAEAIILATLPQLSKNFVRRHMSEILTLSPEAIISTIGYPDPTGDQAVRRILAEQGRRTARELEAAA